jgi:hypothetical protein
MLIGFFKAIAGFILIGLLIFILWDVIYFLFILPFMLLAILLKWAFVGFLIFLAFAAIYGMLKALLKG